LRHRRQLEDERSYWHFGRVKDHGKRGLHGVKFSELSTPIEQCTSSIVTLTLLLCILRRSGLQSLLGILGGVGGGRVTLWRPKVLE
jgi:hypothetical protein